MTDALDRWLVDDEDDARPHFRKASGFSGSPPPALPADHLLEPPEGLRAATDLRWLRVLPVPKPTLDRGDLLGAGLVVVDPSLERAYGHGPEYRPRIYR